MNSRPGSTWSNLGHFIGPVDAKKKFSNLFDLFCGQRLSLFVARGYINHSEGIYVCALPNSVMWQEAQIGLMDLVWYYHVKLWTRGVSCGREVGLPDGLSLEPVLGLLLSHISCRRQLFGGGQPLSVASGL